MNEEERDKINAKIFSKRIKEGELLRDLCLVKGEIEGLRRKLGEG